MRKLIYAIAVTACVTFIAAWFVSQRIETQALWQPHHSTAPYTRPIEVKGVIRYATPGQEVWDLWARRVILGAWFIGFVAFGIINWKYSERP